MRSSSLRYVALLFALVFAVLLAPARVGLGQETEPEGTIEGTVEAFDITPELTTQSSESFTLPAQLPVRVNLPLVRSAPTTSPLQFATQINAATGDPINPGTVFSPVRVLYVGSLVSGAEGLPLRFEWMFPRVGNQTSFVDKKTVNFPVARYVSGIEIRNAKALPKGTYTVKLFLNDVLVQEASATIR